MAHKSSLYSTIVLAALLFII